MKTHKQKAIYPTHVTTGCDKILNTKAKNLSDDMAKVDCYYCNNDMSAPATYGKSPRA